mmetsp:Transcript_31303/g.56809  ORF Transcript_31303/g.56809 Transcript_31303/m.56809 type:complete len:346 (-) Transcript_31303:396-1433(-)
MDTTMENQTSVSQADWCIRQSRHVSTPVTKRVTRARSAATTGATFSFSPRTQRTTAPAKVTKTIHSSRLGGPFSRSFSRARAGASGVFLSSGGTSTYIMAGIMMRLRTEGTTAPLNQRTKVSLIWTPSCWAMLTQRRFWAAPVRKSVELSAEVWRQQCVRKAPNLRRSFSGVDPTDLLRNPTTGAKMPPALAVVDGMAGARRASATVKPYARPIVVLPKKATNISAMRSPKPVFSNPLAKKKEITINQIVSLHIAAMAVPKLSVFVTNAAARQHRVQAPVGKGCVTRPKIAVAKIPTSLQASLLSPVALGRIFGKTKAGIIAIKVAIKLAPFEGAEVVLGGVGAD